jgi:hypothetical protein
LSALGPPWWVSTGVETHGASGLRPHCSDQRCDAEDVHDAGEISRQARAAPSRAHSFQRLHQEVGCAHPGLDGAEAMLGRLAPLTHFLRMRVEPALHRLEDVLMLPSGDAAFLAGLEAVPPRALDRIGAVMIDPYGFRAGRTRWGSQIGLRAEVSALGRVCSSRRPATLPRRREPPVRHTGCTACREFLRVRPLRPRQR